MSEIDRQIDDLVESKNISVARMGLRVMLGFETLSFGIDRVVITTPDKLEFMTYNHAFMIVVVIATLLMGRRNAQWLVRMNLPCVLPVFLRYAYLVQSEVLESTMSISILKSTLAAALVGVFIIVLTPQSTLRIPAFLTILFSSILLYLLAKIPDGTTVAAIGVVGYAAGFAWKAFQVSGRRQGAALEINNRRLVAAAERGRIQVEMDLASAIQDSLRPATTIRSGPIKADFYMKKHGNVGGDWFAAHVQPNGGLLVLIVDATGKGLQAALVVHAVQSLWTAAMADDNFNPKSWILRVNDVLTKMGQGSAHTVTLALADIRRDQMIYWSAGHGPAYLRRTHDGKTHITANFALGNMLGIEPSDNLTLKPTVVPLDAAHGETIYLGTDGVLVGSARKDIKTIERLERDLPKLGVEALGSDVEDDKALVRVEMSAVEERDRAAS